ncbi:MAG: DUF488 domain-containing protein [Acidimicrobiales bacterium]|jgi:uncharacterized protein (DUF488 family)
MTMRLITVGHGTMSAGAFTELLERVRVSSLLDVRSAPGSRRNPAFNRAELEQWLPRAGLSYRWEPRLGGFRRPRADSPNTALRHSAFRGYADHVQTPEFADALDDLVAEANRRDAEPEGGLVSVMCAESVWWRCHRRLIADAATLVHHAGVLHLMHDARLMVHRLTDGVRLGADGLPVYDAGATRRQGT